MKKIIAVMLCLALLLGCAAAVAEAAEKELLGTLDVNGAFELRCRLPEDYKTQIIAMDNTRIEVDIASEDPAKAHLRLTISFDEMFYDVERMNDLDEETLSMLEATYQEEDEVEITYRETSYGTKLMLVRETREGTDFVDVFSIYKGYDVEFLMTPGEGAAESVLTEEQIQMAVDFLSDLDFVAAN